MDQELKLFKLLSDGEFHSGQVLASELAVSRGRVWALMNLLQDKGVLVSRVRGKGYRYRGGSTLLDIQKLGAAFPKIPIYYSPTMTSTNDVAREHCNAKDELLLVTTEFQTGGRGRRGRKWIGSYAHNLMFSLVLPEFSAGKGLDGLSLVVGITLATALNDLYGIKAQVKWPNDVLVDDAKLAGILIEIQGDLGGQYSLIVGVGINVNVVPEVVERETTSLVSLHGHAVDRTALLVMLVNKLKENISKFCKNGFSGFVDEWRELDAYIGRSVEVDMAGKRIVGISGGVNSVGALLIDTEDQVIEVHGGEVTLRSL